MNAKTKGLEIALAAAVALSLLAAAATQTLAAGGLNARMEEAITDFILQRVTMAYDSISVEVSLPPVAARASDIAGFGVDLFPTTRSVVGTVPVKVSVVLNDGQVIPYTATARVRIWSDAAVAARRLGRHDIVSDDDVRLERREVTQAVDGYFVGSGEVVGMRATRVISSGSLVSLSGVEPIPLITRGSDVSVTVVIGSVAITSRCKALEDGNLGSMIQVRDCSTGKRFVGEVAGENLVVLQVSRL